MSLRSQLNKQEKARRGWQNAADVLSEEGKAALKKDMVMGFKQEDDQIHYYKVVHINRKSNKYYIQRMGNLLNEEDIEKMNKIIKEHEEGGGPSAAV
jgi:hypothetical protein